MYVWKDHSTELVDVLLYFLEFPDKRKGEKCPEDYTCVYRSGCQLLFCYNGFFISSYICHFDHFSVVIFGTLNLGVRGTEGLEMIG